MHKFCRRPSTMSVSQQRVGCSKGKKQLEEEGMRRWSFCWGNAAEQPKSKCAQCMEGIWFGKSYWGHVENMCEQPVIGDRMVSKQRTNRIRRKTVWRSLVASTRSWVCLLYLDIISSSFDADIKLCWSSFAFVFSNLRNLFNARRTTSAKEKYQKEHIHGWLVYFERQRKY
jgi:hypothetical protein